MNPTVQKELVLIICVGQEFQVFYRVTTLNFPRALTSGRGGGKGVGKKIGMRVSGAMAAGRLSP